MATLGALESGCDFNPCCGSPSPPGPPTIAPEVTITPPRVTVQVGATVTFTGHVTEGRPMRLQWCRQDRWDAPCIDLPAATDITFTHRGANLSDDGAWFTLKAAYAENPSLWNLGSAILTVSSMPGLVYQDGEFADGQWQVTSFPDAATAGMWNTVSRIASGGNPGAYQAVNFALQTVPLQKLLVYQIYLSPPYDPSTQGAPYVLDFNFDCFRPTSAPGATNFLAPAIWQADRLYYGQWAQGCEASSWQSSPTIASLDASLFLREDYPEDCRDFATCHPDFSATGSPIRFGILTSPNTYNLGDLSGAKFNVGIDNWRVTVWRR
jgi:hypothetical protein